MNPCRRKGDDRNRQFSVFKNGKPYQGFCECAKVRISLNIKEDGRYLRLGMRTHRERAGETLRILNPKHLPQDTIRVVPCYEVFRHIDSKGTKVWRKLFTGKSNFLGCQRLEESLEKEKLVSIKPKEFEEVSWHHIEGTDKEPCFTLPSPDAFLDSYEEMAGYAIELAINPGQRNIAQRISLERATLFSAPALSELIRLSPIDINHAEVRRLYARGLFDHDLKLKTAAYLLTRNIKTEGIIKEILPGYDFQEFKIHKKKIKIILTKHMPERLRRLKKAWKKLTAKQRTALKLKYNEGLTLEEAAHRLQISIDSFRDRLILAEKKLHGAFPEFNRVETMLKVEAENILAVKHFNAQTGVTRVIDIPNKKLTPWGPPKKRTAIYKPEVYRWLDQVCPKI